MKDEPLQRWTETWARAGRALVCPPARPQMKPLLALRETPETLDKLLKLKARIEQGE